MGTFLCRRVKLQKCGLCPFECPLFICRNCLVTCGKISNFVKKILQFFGFKINPFVVLFITFSSWMRRYWFYVKNDFRNFHQIFPLEDPLSQKKGFLRKCLSVRLSVCLSVCLSVGRVRHNSRQNYQIELSFGTLYRSRKSKDKFVNQRHLIKIEGLSTTFVFLKIIFFLNKKFQYWFNYPDNIF